MDIKYQPKNAGEQQLELLNSTVQFISVLAFMIVCLLGLLLWRFW